jgi:hypothetical protein
MRTRFHCRSCNSLKKLWMPLQQRTSSSSRLLLRRDLRQPFWMAVTSRNAVDILRASFTVQREAGTRRPWPHDETGTPRSAGPYRFSSISLILKCVVIWNSPLKSVGLPHNVKADIGNGLCTPISHCFSNSLVTQYLLDLERLTQYWCERLQRTYKTGPHSGRVLTSWSRWSITADCLSCTFYRLICGGDCFYSPPSRVKIWLTEPLAPVQNAVWYLC